MQAEIEEGVSSSISELTPSSDESPIPSDIDTSELEDMEAEQERIQSNQHGFIYEADLNTYRMTKRERIDAAKEEKKGQEK